MSSDPVIRVNKLSKSFPIYAQPSDRLKQFIFPRLQRLFGLSPKKYYRTFDALSDVSFEIQRGETVGIIGRNGAGKSTLLQILCGTLAPTSGEVEVKGRVAALLELGAGFNGEYTGRENVYMNARILGLTEAEIDARFDEIVAFADIAEHLDQPVKTYSSGMFVRLAFSVVVHVNADILIIDEALAVGDAFFQSKCIAHLKRLIDSGVTLLFVSHDINAVKSLCASALFFNKGFLADSGDVATVSESYYQTAVQADVANTAISTINSTISSIQGNIQFDRRASTNRVTNNRVTLLDVFLTDKSLKRTELFEFGQAVVLHFIFRSNDVIPLLGAAYHIRTVNGFDVVYSDTGIEKSHIENLQANMLITVTWEFKLNLKEGNYTVAAMLSIPRMMIAGNVEICDFVPHAAVLSVARGNEFPIYGAVYWPNRLKVERYVLE
jgi:lipopolysaccharide transport system ATP-binding protein